MDSSKIQTTIPREINRHSIQEAAVPFSISFLFSLIMLALLGYRLVNGMGARRQSFHIASSRHDLPRGNRQRAG